MARPAKEPSIQDEVLGNIRAQVIGRHTVADLHLPVEFLRRVADRVIRESFVERFRMVVRDAPVSSDPVEGPASSVARRVRVVRPTTPADVVRARGLIPEGRPGLRGYRARLGGAAPGVTEPSADNAASGELVGRRLAIDGLCRTAIGVMDLLLRDGASAGDTGTLAAADAGLPVDLLAFFSDDGRAETVVADIARRLSAGESTAQISRDLERRPFRFRPSVPGFRVFSESGEHQAGIIRVQITGGGYWGGRGAGGSQDLLRELLAAAPESRVIVSVEDQHAEGLLKLTADWPEGAESRVMLVAQPLPVSQWAQDNGKAGAAAGRAVTLVPRYASRSEDGAVLVPGETFLADGLAAAGLSVMQSPLLFQGGNLLAVHDDARGELVLLVGEAEVHRNVTLGLTAAQATEALRVEFGADRCVVLPAASFHIDAEVSVRAVPKRGEIVAFVSDTPGAARLVLESGIGALERSGAMGMTEARRAAELLRGNRMREVLEMLGAAMGRVAVGPGQFPERLAGHFATGTGDSGPANLRVFLLAMDLAAASLTMAVEDRNFGAYLAAIRRRDADRRVLHRKLRDLGWRLVNVPTFAEGALAPNALNGIHEPRRYLMPAWGGWLSALDSAAARSFESALDGDLEVVPITCGESQRRGGGVHCSVAAIAAGFGV